MHLRIFFSDFCSSNTPYQDCW